MANAEDRKQKKWDLAFVFEFNFEQWQPNLFGFEVDFGCGPISVSAQEVFSVEISLEEMDTMASIYSQYGESRCPDKCLEPLKPLHQRLRKCLDFSKEYFIRLGTRSPKDVAGHPKPLTLPIDIIKLLVRSQRVFEDTAWYRSDEALGGRANDFPNVTRPPMLLHCIQWKDMKPSRELRCFLFNKSLVAITQYDLYHPFGFSEEDLGVATNLIEQLVNADGFAERLPYENCVLDVEVVLSHQSKDLSPRVWVVEFNAYCKYTDSVLFDWEEDRPILFSIPDAIVFRIRPPLSKNYNELHIGRQIKTLHSNIPMNYSDHIDVVLSLLIKLYPSLQRQLPACMETVEKRKILGDVLISTNSSSEEISTHMDVILTEELGRKTIIRAQELPRDYYNGKVGLWKGDITVLEIDCIVNAANEAMLGCFQPSHKCIDNVIHRAAGPRLRVKCVEMMKGSKDPPGTARLTDAYCLPSKFVAHTCGPRVTNFMQALPTQDLKSCYRSVLEACAEKEDIRSVAFCCVSTGLFGYPNEPAAQLAIEVVFSFLQQSPDALDYIIFDTFLPKDYVVYRKLLDATLDSH